MDTLPLPPRPSLAQYKKRAKGLVTAAKLKDEGAVRVWAGEWLETLARLLDVPITPFVQGSFERAVAEIEARVREKIGTSHARGATFMLADAEAASVPVFLYGDLAKGRGRPRVRGGR